MCQHIGNFAKTYDIVSAVPIEHYDACQVDGHGVEALLDDVEIFQTLLCWKDKVKHEGISAVVVG